MAANYITEQMRTARVAKGITLKEMATLLGLAEATVGNAERGQQSMKIEKIARVSHVLDVPLADLVTHTPRRPRKDSAAA